MDLLTPLMCVDECYELCELDAETQTNVGSIADALAGYRSHYGERAEPVTWPAVRRLLETQGCVITEPDIVMGVKLSTAGETMAEA